MLPAMFINTKSARNLLSGLVAACVGMGGALVYAGDVVVSKAWARASAPGQTVAGVYLDIESSADARLVGVETTAAAAAELHFMSMQDGVMRMRRVAQIELPAGATVSLRPGGYHVMLFDLRQPLQAGDRTAIELLVEDVRGERIQLPVSVEIRRLDGSRVERHEH
jgi:copper(I)-binding protein